MPILIHRCYEIITEKSAQHGDAAKRGFAGKNESLTFRELVNTLQHGTPSNWPARGDVREWVQYDTSTDFRTGAETAYTIHYSRRNPSRMARYWTLAFKAAGLVK